MVSGQIEERSTLPNGLEGISDQYTLTSAVHNGAFYGGDLGNAPSSNPQTAQQRLTDLCTAYHNFQLHWTASSLVIGVDNVPT